YIEADPGRLYGFASRSRQPLDGRDALTNHRRNWCHARACWLAVDVHGTGPTERHTATELRSGELQVIADGPQQRHLRIDIQLGCLIVHRQFDRHVDSPEEGDPACEAPRGAVRYRSNQARIALALAADCEGRAARPP